MGRDKIQGKIPKGRRGGQAINKKRPAVKAGQWVRAATYSPGCDPSTIGAAGLNFSVRYGKRWVPCAGPPNVFRALAHISLCPESRQGSQQKLLGATSSRAISTARLCRCRLYTCGLSTSSSPTALVGSLILGWVSHLDAFSAYPFPT